MKLSSEMLQNLPYLGIRKPKYFLFNFHFDLRNPKLLEMKKNIFGFSYSKNSMANFEAFR